MHVTLPSHLEERIREQMTQGGFSTPADLIEAALLQFELQAKFAGPEPQLEPWSREQWRKELQFGLDQIARGEVVDGPTAMRRIMEELEIGPAEQP